MNRTNRRAIGREKGIDMNKNQIDEEAEREAKALSKQGRSQPMFIARRLNSQTEYNQAEFDKLFKPCDCSIIVFENQIKLFKGPKNGYTNKM